MTDTTLVLSLSFAALLAVAAIGAACGWFAAMLLTDEA